MYRRKFDPVKYWSTKPQCEICKKRKVKHGNICHECREEGGWDTTIIAKDQKRCIENWRNTCFS